MSDLSASTIFSSTSCGFLYRVCTPSRFRTARPPSVFMAMAKRTSTTPSMALARIGIFNSSGSVSLRGKRNLMSTSLGLIVTRPGTSAISSNPYVTRALRFRPIHIPISNPLHPESFVQTSAVRAPRKQRIGSILVFERANHTPQPVLQSPSLPPPAIPFSNYPEEENRRKKKQQINRDKSSKTDANHGVALAPPRGCGLAMSFPHWIVATPQASNESALSGFAALLEKRQRATYKRAC